MEYQDLTAQIALDPRNYWEFQMLMYQENWWKIVECRLPRANVAERVSVLVEVN
jgi:hypothetical protein